MQLKLEKKPKPKAPLITDAEMQKVVPTREDKAFATTTTTTTPAFVPFATTTTTPAPVVEDTSNPDDTEVAHEPLATETTLTTVPPV